MDKGGVGSMPQASPQMTLNCMEIQQQVYSVLPFLYVVLPIEIQY